jgi:hypothetical protein
LLCGYFAEVYCGWFAQFVLFRRKNKFMILASCSFALVVWKDYFLCLKRQRPVTAVKQDCWLKVSRYSFFLNFVFDRRKYSALISATSPNRKTLLAIFREYCLRE